MISKFPPNAVLTEAWYGLRGYVVTRSAIRIWMIIVVWLFLFSAIPFYFNPPPSAQKESF